MLAMHGMTPIPATRFNLYTRVVLTLTVILGGLLVLRPAAVAPVSAHAQSEMRNIYVEPGTIIIRSADGSSLEGKMMIDLNTGDVWGYPMTTLGAVDPPSGSGEVSKPVFLGRFDLSSIR